MNKISFSIRDDEWAEFSRSLERHWTPALNEMGLQITIKDQPIRNAYDMPSVGMYAGDVLVIDRVVTIESLPKGD